MPKSTTKRPSRKSPWLKRVLIPFWILQLLFVVFHLGVEIWASLASTRVIGILTMLICFICLFLDMSEIILFARRALKPVTYLVFQCVKAGLWFIVFLLTVLGTAVWEGEEVGSDELMGWSVLIEVVVLFTAFVSTLIYASVIYRRHRLSARLARSRSLLNHERYDPFYHGPFSDPRIVEANYSRDPNDASRPPTYVEYSSNGFPDQRQPQTNDGDELLLESGGREVALPRRSSGCGEELEGDREAFELATNRSVRSVGPLE